VREAERSAEVAAAASWRAADVNQQLAGRVQQNNDLEAQLASLQQEAAAAAQHSEDAQQQIALLKADTATQQQQQQQELECSKADADAAVLRLQTSLAAARQGPVEDRMQVRGEMQQ